MAAAQVKTGLEGVVAAETRISGVDGEAGELVIGGYAVEELAPQAAFEEVVYLLWNGRLPKRDELAALKSELAANRAIPQPVVDFLGGVPKAAPMDVLRTAVSMLSLYDPLARDMSPGPSASVPCNGKSSTRSGWDRLRCVPDPPLL